MTITAPATAQTKQHSPLAYALAALALILTLGVAAITIYLANHQAQTVVQPVSGIHTCDTQTATAYPAIGGGVTVNVNAPGPDVVTVGVIAGAYGQEHRLTQQVTRKGSGAIFKFEYLYGVSAITVMSKKFGLCNLPTPGQ